MPDLKDWFTATQVMVYVDKAMSAGVERESKQMIEMWKELHRELDPRCCRCGVAKFEHGSERSSWPGYHPFFANNLEMVEYYEQKTKAVNL